MELAKKCLEEKINSLLDEIHDNEIEPAEDRSLLHFEYIQELKDNVSELRRSQVEMGIKVNKNKPEIEVINSGDKDAFKKNVNGLLERGWKLLSVSGGFVNSEKYDFCDSFYAILIKEGQ